MSKKSIKFLKYICSFAILAIAIYFLNKWNVFKNFSPKELKEYLGNYGIWASVVYIIMFTLVPLTLFPDSVLAIGGGLAFGLIKGSIYTLIGAVLGGTLSFYIARFLGRDFVKKLTSHKLAHFEKSLEKNGFVVVLLLRMIPLFPFDIVSYSAGCSNIRYKDFIFATLIGTIPGIVVYTNLGDKSANIGSKSFYVSICLLILLFLASFLLKKKFSFKNLKEIREE
ncbi:TVP38/TMEM64 family protein [Haloimpatiens lingqiaonensis]|uniref:TVP38/TMEM64 family protein n=1 Tax=Haloimpatiens lingqiaonensis TaxID=1380675 RepID=UPI0010FE86DB|nr:TVP38/TMEM64 family protein [Haloimpatiens lingqiaonensis]